MNDDDPFRSLMRDYELEGIKTILSNWNNRYLNSVMRGKPASELSTGRDVAKTLAEKLCRETMEEPNAMIIYPETIACSASPVPRYSGMRRPL